MTNLQNIKIITAPIPVADLRQSILPNFGTFVKGVVDIEQRHMAIGGELHADEEAVLLEQGSKQENLWGINLYPDQSPPGMVEFDSMINIRPNQNNRSRGVDDPNIQKQILDVVTDLIIV